MTNNCRHIINADDDDWCFTATFVHMVGEMGRATSKGNEAKSRIKHPSDKPTQRFELCGPTRFQLDRNIIELNYYCYYHRRRISLRELNVNFIDPYSDVLITSINMMAYTKLLFLAMFHHKNLYIYWLRLFLQCLLYNYYKWCLFVFVFQIWPLSDFHSMSQKDPELR